MWSWSNTRRRVAWAVGGAALAALLSACTSAPEVTATPAPSASSSAPSTPSPASTASATPTPSQTPSPSATEADPAALTIDITIAGGTNVFADIGQLYPEINIEELVRRDPDVIIIARENADDLRAELAGLPVWREMRSVKAGRVFRVSPYDFNRSGPLMPRAARTLADFFASVP